MKIVADKNIPLVAEAFSGLGEVVLQDGAAISKEIVNDVDILLVRSVTTVDKALLAGSRVRFVGSATSGIDHVDLDYLERKKVKFAYAPGSNANSVAEYVIAALVFLADKYRYRLQGKSIGVVGVGHVGSRVVEMARALGLKVLCNDPPKARNSPENRYLSLDELMECDILTLHVPLTRSGPDATGHLFNAERFDRVKKGCVFINTSRGEVVDSQALKQAIGSGCVRHAVLDVWENEPQIDVALMQMASIATPHIAGYAYDGKVKGTRMLYRAAADFFKLPEKWVPDISTKNQVIAEPPKRSQREGLLHEVIRQGYDIKRDDTDLRGIANKPADERRRTFRELRCNYRFRREFPNFVVRLTSDENQIAGALSKLGFQVELR